MSSKSSKSAYRTIIFASLLPAIGLAISWFSYRSTTQIQEALAEEILEQQHDVATLIQEYSNVLISLENSRFQPSASNDEKLATALQIAQEQLKIMRSNYSFERLDGAAEAHAYVKPIIEDVDQWTKNGFANLPRDSNIVLNTASTRMKERFDPIKKIALETDFVARELISEQSKFLVKFRNWLMLFITSFAFLSLAIATLLIRQRNLQAQIAIDQDRTATEHIYAQTQGRQKAESALHQSENFLRATLNSLPSDIAILNQSGVITEANMPWKHFVSASSTPYTNGGIGNHYESVFRAVASSTLDKKSIDLAMAKVANVLNKRNDSMYFEYPRKETEERKWSVISMTTFNTGEDRHAVLVHEDVSNRKILEERDRRLRSELAHVSRLTTAGELASGLAHELNQPLTAITHNCDAIISSAKAELELDKETIETLDDIASQAQRAGSIIRSMRQMVRKNSSDKVATDLNQLVRETVHLTGPEAREKGITVLLKLDENLPHPLIDPVQIQQVLVNLERNGVEAMWQANSQNRYLSIETSLSQQDNVLITIQDTGPGVDPSYEQQLFYAFQTTKAEGMGLGLSISRTIVEEHGGRLWIEQGRENTTFKFTIPYKAE